MIEFSDNLLINKFNAKFLLISQNNYLAIFPDFSYSYSIQLL